LPIDTSTEPLACGATFNSKLMGRISSGARPSLRCIKEKLNAGPSLRDEDLRRRKWRLLNHLVHPELRAASQHEYGDVACPIDSQLGSNAGGLFTLHGPTICRSSALLSAGVGVQWNECVSTYVYYNWAATITPATTSTADCGPVSEKSVPHASLAIRVDKGNNSRNTMTQRITNQRMFMKRFIPTIAILLPLFLFAACGPSKNPEANATAGSSAASAATITASPNPVTVGEGPGTTTVTWNTGDGTAGQVYVSVDGGPEAVFAFGPSGSNAASWIQAGKTFEFRLYAGAEHTKVLAKTQVTARK